MGRIAPDWRLAALSESSFEQCLDALLTALRTTFGASAALACSPCWSVWRTGAGAVEPWTAVLERYVARIHAELYVPSREALLKSEPSLADLDVPEGALAIMPLGYSGDPRGAVALVFDEPRELSPAERKQLASFVEQAVPVMDRACLLFEVERERRRWKLIGDTGLAITASLDYASTLDRIVRLSVLEFADWAAVDLLEDGVYERVAVACADPVKHALAQQLKGSLFRQDAGTWGVSDVITRAQPKLVTTLTDEMLQASARDQFHLEVMRAMQMRSFVSAPLFVGDRVIGALSLASGSRAYDARDLETGIEIARRAAHAMENARLYSVEQRTARRLQKLQEVTLALASARTPEDVTSVATRHAAEAIGARSAGVWLSQPDGTLKLECIHGVPDEYVDEFERIEKATALQIREVARTGKPMWIETAEQFRTVAPTLYEHALAAGLVHPHAVLPIRGHDQLLGVMSYGYVENHVFTDDDRRYLQTFVDATGQALERAQLYVREKAAHERAEQASRAKDEFLAMLGHELRNPLAPIVTALDLMKLKNSGQLDREATVIERHVSHLTHLVDDLLDIARITRGAVVLRRQPTDVAEAVRQAIEAVSVLVEDRVHVLDVAVPPGITVDADRARLVQVITNLLTNAARYTSPGGKIRIGAERRGATAIIRVRDNGKGISPTLLPKIFDLFVQGERSADRSEGGLGLGLSIVRNLVRMHGGTITASSAGLGTGAEFTIEWPLVTEREATTGIASAMLRPLGSGQLKILVVDDNEDAAMMLTELIRSRGHEVITAHDGAAALAAVKDAAPDLAILDIGLPVMDGYELAEQIRRRPELTAVKLVALTGFGHSTDVERAKRAGFDRHVVKPIDMSVLDEILARPS